MSEQEPGETTVIKWVETLDDLNDPAKLAAAPIIDPALIGDGVMNEDGSVTVTYPDGDVRTFDRLRLVCECGTPIPAARAGRDRCSAVCDDREAARQRAEVSHQLLADAQEHISDYMRREMFRRAEES